MYIMSMNVIYCTMFVCLKFTTSTISKMGYATAHPVSLSALIFLLEYCL